MHPKKLKANRKHLLCQAKTLQKKRHDSLKKKTRSSPSQLLLLQKRGCPTKCRASLPDVPDKFSLFRDRVRLLPHILPSRSSPAPVCPPGARPRPRRSAGAGGSGAPRPRACSLRADGRSSSSTERPPRPGRGAGRPPSAAACGDQAASKARHRPTRGLPLKRAGGEAAESRQWSPLGPTQNAAASGAAPPGRGVRTDLAASGRGRRRAEEGSSALTPAMSLRGRAARQGVASLLC